MVSTMMMSYGAMGVVTLLWGLVGYSLAFSESTSTGVIGNIDLAAVSTVPAWNGTIRHPSPCRICVLSCGLSHLLSHLTSLLSPISPRTQSKFGDQLRPGAGAITEHTFMIFQLMFAIITSAIISGAVVQKMK